MSARVLMPLSSACATEIKRHGQMPSHFHSKARQDIDPSGLYCGYAPRGTTEAPTEVCLSVKT
jgi:hypothetical protein